MRQGLIRVDEVALATACRQLRFAKLPMSVVVFPGFWTCVIVNVAGLIAMVGSAVCICCTQMRLDIVGDGLFHRAKVCLQTFVPELVI